MTAGFWFRILLTLHTDKPLCKTGNTSESDNTHITHIYLLCLSTKASDQFSRWSQCLGQRVVRAILTIAAFLKTHFFYISLLIIAIIHTRILLYIMKGRISSSYCMLYGLPEHDFTRLWRCCVFYGFRLFYFFFYFLHVRFYHFYSYSHTTWMCTMNFTNIYIGVCMFKTR